MVQLQSYHYLHLPLLSVYEDSLNCSVCHELKLLGGYQGSHVLHLVIQYFAPYSLIDAIVRNHKDDSNVIYNDMSPLQIACGNPKKSGMILIYLSYDTDWENVIITTNRIKAF